MPKGWKAKLAAKNSNVSRAICEAVAAHYGWPYDMPDRTAEKLQVDVVSPLTVKAVKELLSGVEGVVVRTVERSTLNPMMVMLTKISTGETSAARSKRDGRVIVKKRKAIEKLIDEAAK